MSGVRSEKGVLVLAGNGLGRPEDMPLRSRDYLREAEVLVFESDKGARSALKNAGVHRPYLLLSEHREQSTLEEVTAAFGAAKTVLYMSDQGVPTLADPGKELVKLALSAKSSIQVIPGPSSITVALSAWPHRLDRFQYLGFPPADREERSQFLALHARTPDTMVILDTPYRLAALLNDVRTAFGAGRQGMLAFDISGEAEEFLHDTIGGLAEKSASYASKKLNFVLVIEGAGDESRTVASVRDRVGMTVGRVKSGRRFVKRKR